MAEQAKTDTTAAAGRKAEANQLSPVEQLDRDHLAATLAQQGKIEEEMKNLQAAEAAARKSRLKVAQLRRDKMTASYAYDTKRAELVAATTVKAA